MKAERDFIIKKLEEAGVRGKIHGSMKALKNCSEGHVGAVLRNGEEFTRSGSKKRYTDQEGHRKQRNRLFDRVTRLHVIIADTSEEKVEEILTRFLTGITKGFPVDRSWVGIEIGEADWVEEGDSILKSRIAVEFDVTLTGGIYEDVDPVTARIDKIHTGQEGE